MLSVSFDVDGNQLRSPRVIEIKTRSDSPWSIPDTSLYRPLRRFIDHYNVRFNGNYQFRIYQMLQVAAIKILGGKVKKNDFSKVLFATGGLYLALNHNHPSLAIERTFGDFTSGFSHQFGVALAVMVMSEAFKIPWDCLVPIPANKKSRSLDYEAKLPDGNWLQLEAKGITTANRANARKSIATKKNVSSAPMTNTAMLGVIVQASREQTTNGVIEIIDPEFDHEPDTRRTENQLAGRYLHYAGVARFAGLHNVSEEFQARAIALLDDRYRDRYNHWKIAEDIHSIQIMDRTILGVQWQLGNNTAGKGSLWFYQGVDLDTLNQVIAGRFPDTAPFDSETEDSRFAQQSSILEVASYLPDGSFFGIGDAPLANLLIVDKEQDISAIQLGRIVKPSDPGTNKYDHR